MKVASYLKDIKYNDKKPALTLLLDTVFTKEIRIVFKKGQVMKDHQAPFAIIVQITEGIINFGVDNEMYQLKTGDMISLKPHEVHNLLALENSIVRLSLLKTDSVKRVKEAVE